MATYTIPNNYIYFKDTTDGHLWTRMTYTLTGDTVARTYSITLTNVGLSVNTNWATEWHCGHCNFEINGQTIAYKSGTIVFKYVPSDDGATFKDMTDLGFAVSSYFSNLTLGPFSYDTYPTITAKQTNRLFVGYTSSSRGNYHEEDVNGTTKGGSTSITTPLAHTLSISAGVGSSITVQRTSSNMFSTGTLTNGAAVYQGDVLKVTFGVDTAYNLSTHTVNGSSFTSSNSYTVPASLSNNTLVIKTTTSVKSYTLTTSISAGSTLTVRRTSSPKQGASTGNLSSGATIYYSDVLQISFSVNEGYDNGKLTVNNSTFTSGNSHTVTGNVAVSSTASLKVYKLILEAGKGSTITVSRESSLRNDAELGVLANDADIYHFDVLTITFASTPEYEILTQTVNGSDFVNGDSHDVTGAVIVTTTTRLLGIIYIDNGTKFEKYAVFIDNGTTWDQYIPYIDNGTKFVQYS